MTDCGEANTCQVGQVETIHGVDKRSFVETKTTNAAFSGKEQPNDGDLQLLHLEEPCQQKSGCL